VRRKYNNNWRQFLPIWRTYTLMHWLEIFRSIKTNTICRRKDIFENAICKICHGRRLVLHLNRKLTWRHRRRISAKILSTISQIRANGHKPFNAVTAQGHETKGAKKFAVTHVTSFLTSVVTTDAATGKRWRQSRRMPAGCRSPHQQTADVECLVYRFVMNWVKRGNC
jgi:hypothetical protein